MLNKHFTSRKTFIDCDIINKQLYLTNICQMNNIIYNRVRGDKKAPFLLNNDDHNETDDDDDDDDDDDIRIMTMMMKVIMIIVIMIMIIINCF